jgi:hypothetical protein
MKIRLPVGAFFASANPVSSIAKAKNEVDRSNQTVLARFLIAFLLWFE